MALDELNPDVTRRRARFAAIAAASHERFADLWQALGLDPAFTMVRGPETGLISIRGRIGGGGAAFPFGDATATRATVRLEDGAIGHAVLLGRNKARTTIAAVIDALCADSQIEAKIEAELIAPLAASVEARDAHRAAETAATKVDFFTMVRGED